LSSAPPRSDPSAEHRIEPDPAAPDYGRRDPAAPTPAEGRVEDIELVVTEREMTGCRGRRDGG